MTLIRRSDIDDLSDKELQPVYELERALNIESWPEDGFVDFRSWAIWNRNRPSHSRTTLLLASADGRLVGYARVSWEDVPENRHLAGVGLAVDSRARRRGLGRRLLAEAAAVAEGDGRTLLTGGSSTRTPAGEAFARSVGASLGLLDHESRLRLDEVDQGMLREWMRPPAGYRALQIDGPTPPELVEEVARLMELMNQAPRGDLEEEDYRERPDQMIQWEQALNAAGHRVWSVYSQHEMTTRLVGFTRLSWHPSKPHTVEQWGTAVAPDHRGHGLGRLVKATNLDRLLKEVPNVREVSTTNATINRWMLAINHALGFRPVAQYQHWQVETGKVRG